MRRAKFSQKYQRITWICTYWLYRIISIFLYRVKIVRKGSIPEKGPVLFLGNHCAVMDAAFVVHAANCPIIFLTNERLFKKKVIGKLMRLLGMVSKRKIESDSKALIKLIRHARAGYRIGIFPEGKRSWDGNLQPLIPGLARLIKLLDIPVVFVRNRTSYLQSPQWAKHDRWVPIQLEVSEAVHFNKYQTLEEINQIVADEIRIDPLQIKAPFASVGFRTAHGLSKYLWACPSCFEQEKLVAYGILGNRIKCNHCLQAWKLTIDQILIPISKPREPLPITLAYRRIAEYYDDVFNPQLSSVDTFLRSEQSCLFQQTNKEIQQLSKGVLKLNRQEIVLVGYDEQIAWSLKLKQIIACFIQEGKLYLRSKHALFFLTIENESLLKWFHFISRNEYQPLEKIKK